MALYTKTGDEGFSDLAGRGGSAGPRARKDDARFAALGGVDELNAAVGWCLCEVSRINHIAIRSALGPVREELLAVGAILATVGAGGPPPVHLDPSAVERMERDIDAVSADLPELKHFILPGGSELACRLHVARAVARRAERAAVAALTAPQGLTRRPRQGAAGKTPAAPANRDAADVLTYLNRLGDLLFALARLANRDSGEPDTLWMP